MGLFLCRFHLLFIDIMRILAVIPSRYGSTRFPGKSLAKIGSLSLIQQAYTHAKRIDLLSDVIVATDDERIVKNVEEIGGKVMLSTTNHSNGTERCAETASQQDIQPDIVINIQGDVPFVEPEHLFKLIKCFDDKEVEIASLCKKITESDTILDVNTPKVVFDKHKNALYFSRSPIPFIRGKEQTEWGRSSSFYKHIGIYAFRNKTLQEVVKLPKSPLETAESLEQLRWLENGYQIRMAETEVESISIDSKEDLKVAEAYRKRRIKK